MELDDDDNDVIIPTAEELFDKSFHELSQKKNNKKGYYHLNNPL